MIYIFSNFQSYLFCYYYYYFKRNIQLRRPPQKLLGASANCMVEDRKDYITQTFALFPSGTHTYITQEVKGETLDLAKDVQPLSNPQGDSSLGKGREICSLIKQQGLCLLCTAPG
ncbi:hypothetical protein CEXT_79451 [Caerostris extrusa]|uniref:Uncharacterized protein n=1 Tax=Caerostris extrusa TaxID=172846 RepID=A0AAV4VFI3_CAEEX|nr:hypothetical protein CEXT_79451 [Caerostris extrusa]